MKNYCLLNLLEIKHLSVGDKIFITICDKYYPSTIVRPLFWNSDADEPDWEVETNNGFADIYSIYREAI